MDKDEEMITPCRICTFSLVILATALLLLSCHGQEEPNIDFSVERSREIPLGATYYDVVSRLGRPPGKYTKTEGGPIEVKELGLVWWENDTDFIGVLFDENDCVSNVFHYPRTIVQDNRDTFIGKLLRKLGF